ncbi:uncharacterized protein BO87DRAFT_101362 [Aspergillus neoniger CBS 115656]|uniref:Uncharacterized protein n=1 Tax=Aspergillus neoniger (strain CBS 115656) TaxID=1448310 RepID=A0A318YEU7_ASPNB|nr:hypothetical protein BO87DRAFT_101362 [Aspergillus neoniger CBS 115656]PYH32931.1 hypothetical protein BO87DRAFT_101362 [Aspergillus neoniger CBS 115656]
MSTLPWGIIVPVTNTRNTRNIQTSPFCPGVSVRVFPHPACLCLLVSRQARYFSCNLYFTYHTLCSLLFLPFRIFVFLTHPSVSLHLGLFLQYPSTHTLCLVMQHGPDHHQDKQESSSWMDQLRLRPNGSSSPGAVSIHGELRGNRASSTRSCVGGTRTRPSCPPSGGSKPHGLWWLMSTATRDKQFGGWAACRRNSSSRFFFCLAPTLLTATARFFFAPGSAHPCLGREGYC